MPTSSAYPPPPGALSDGGPWGAPSDADLGEAMRRLVQFQKDAAELKKCDNVETALDQMERLLEHIVEFVFARTYLRDEDGQLRKVREFCPESVTVDHALLEWGAQNADVAVVPIEVAEGDLTLRSLVLMPFAGAPDNLGIMLLWLPQDTSAFTQEQEARLGILIREIAAVLETLRFRASLEKARGTLDDIVESVPHGLMAIDGDDFVILINGTMEIALGVRRAQTIGVPYMAALPPEVAKFIHKLIAGGIRDEKELSLAIGHGVRHLGFTATPVRLDRERNGRGHVVLCRDLELSHEIAKLRELDTMKNDFLALVSHELRTPLTSIISYTEMLLFDPDTPRETSQEYLATIADEGHKLNRLITNVLDLTQMQAGRLEYHLNPVDANDFVSTVLMHKESAIADKKQTVELDLADDLPEIVADSDRLAQALRNILDNANKYTPEGGRIALRTRLSPPDRAGGPVHVQIDIEDNGQGIDAEHREKVFNKFGIGGNIAHHTSGTGLGLVIAKHIIEEGHGGRIWLESEPGQGTKVHVRLPATR